MSSSLAAAKRARSLSGSGLDQVDRSTAVLDAQFEYSWHQLQQFEDVVDQIRRHMAEYMESMKGNNEETHRQERERRQMCTAMFSSLSLISSFLVSRCFSSVQFDSQCECLIQIIL